MSSFIPPQNKFYTDTDLTRIAIVNRFPIEKGRVLHFSNIVRGPVKQYLDTGPNNGRNRASWEGFELGLSSLKGPRLLINRRVVDRRGAYSGAFEDHPGRTS